MVPPLSRPATLSTSGGSPERKSAPVPEWIFLAAIPSPRLPLVQQSLLGARLDSSALFPQQSRNRPYRLCLGSPWAASTRRTRTEAHRRDAVLLPHVWNAIPLRMILAGDGANDYPPSSIVPPLQSKSALKDLVPRISTQLPDDIRRSISLPSPPSSS